MYMYVGMYLCFFTNCCSNQSFIGKLLATECVEVTGKYTVSEGGVMGKEISCMTLIDAHAFAHAAHAPH